MNKFIKRILYSACTIGIATILSHIPAQAAGKAMISHSANEMCKITQETIKELDRYEFGIGYEALGFSAIGIIKASSSDETIFSVSLVEDELESYYVLIGHKAGTAYLRIKNADGENYKAKVIVHNPAEVSETELRVQQGYEIPIEIFGWGESEIWPESANKSIATASFKALDPNNEYEPLVMVIKGKKAGTTTIKIKNDIDAPAVKIKVTVTKKDPTPTVETPTGKRRALVIGQEYCCDNRLTACPNDASAMSNVLKNSGYTSVVKMKDASKKDIKNGIINTFKGAKKNDVSLFYFSGHGSEGGCLCTREKNCDIKLISPRELAGWLSQIPGKVIVISDSCFSGGMINKSAGNVTFKSNKSFINAFQEVDPMTKSGGDLRKNKFKVLTACSKKQYSYCTEDYGFFTKILIDGAGYKYADGSKEKKAPADLNKDNFLTLFECQRYSNQFIHPDLDQNSQCYPENSGFVIFKR